MATKTISVYEALEERKLLLKRIEDRKASAGKFAYITYAKKDDDIIDGVSRQKVENQMIANFDSTIQLIKNLATYNAAINQSNAVTKLTIDEKEYTVAEAIARYQSIGFEETFLNDLIKQFNSNKATVQRDNKIVQDPAEVAKFINGVLGDSKKDEGLINSTRDNYLRSHLKELVDPNNLEERLQGMIDNINNFEKQFHFMLTKSNAVTNITIELE